MTYISFVKKKKKKERRKKVDVSKIQTSHLPSQCELSKCEAEFAHKKRSGLTLSVSLFDSTTQPGEDQRIFSLPDLFWCSSFPAL